MRSRSRFAPSDSRFESIPEPRPPALRGGTIRELPFNLKSRGPVDADASRDKSGQSESGLPEAYQRALVETVVDLDILTELVRRNLEDDDIRRVLQKLTSDDRDAFISKLSGLMRKTAALLLIHRRLSDSLFVDVLLPRPRRADLGVSGRGALLRFPLRSRDSRAVHEGRRRPGGGDPLSGHSGDRGGGPRITRAGTGP